MQRRHRAIGVPRFRHRRFNDSLTLWSHGRRRRLDLPLAEVAGTAGCDGLNADCNSGGGSLYRRYSWFSL